MTMRHTTPFAARLLQRLVPTQDHSALVGDLQEERQRGRSMAWYAWQILAAIAVGSWRDIRGHRLLTLGAIGIGTAALVVYFFAGAPLFNLVQRRLYDGILVSNHWIYWRPRPQSVSWTLTNDFPVVWFFGGFLFSGWAIGRLHRAHGITFVLVFAVVVQLLSLGLIGAVYILEPRSRVPVEPSGHTTYFNPLWMSLCVVIGGLFATRRPEVAGR
jgi:hypothetical protein